MALSTGPRKWAILAPLLGLLVLAGDHFIRFSLILPGFAELEQQEVERNLARIRSAIEREILHVQILATDWAQWDDLYRYAADGNQDFAESNFNWETLAKTGIHLIYVVNDRGETVYGHAIGPEKADLLRLKQFPERNFPADHPLLRSAPGTVNFSGILLTDHGPLLLTSHKILTSDGKGPSRGTFFLGRFLDQEVIASLNEQTQVAFTVQDPMTTLFTDKDVQRVQALMQGMAVSEIVDDHTVNAFAVVSDLHGQPGLLVAARIPRAIMERGRITAGFSSVAILVSFSLAVFSVVVFALISIHRSRRRQQEIKDLVEQRTDQLRLSEERLHALSDAAFEAIFLTEKGIVLEQNRAAEMMFGYSHEEAVGRHANLWVAPEDRDHVISRILEQENLPYEATGIKKDGSSFPIQIQTRQAEYRGRRVRVNAVRDLTAQKRAENEQQAMEDKLRRSQKMESLGLMAGGVAHDLNNILSGIVNYPELMLMNLPEDSPMCAPLRAIRDSGRSAAAVVDDLLSLARGVSTVRENNNLNAIVAAYLESPEFHNLKSSHSTVRFRTELEPDLLNISCSTIHIKKCVMNLVTNAAEAIMDKGEIVVSTRNEYCEGALPGFPEMEKGEYAVLTVGDTGMGIPEESLERIFEPFYSRKVVGRSGTGLGLALAWSTVRDHQGAITVESGAGGTIFELYFPANRLGMVVTEEVADLARFRGQGQKVLVVDDDQQQRVLARQILEHLGYRAETIASGEEAVTLLKRERCDLVILDMVMDPGINGCETYRRISEIHPGQLAIITSGYSESAEVQKAMALGVRRFVKKPYTIGTIAAVIHDTLHSR
ncbi:MAG: response regulator [Desulfobulbaceae bacterium]|nr:MAG: response regulator [Desulfobulbaceae bacterium]